MTPELIEDASFLLGELRARKLMLATAESCTGGLISATLTEVPGSSDVVERGFVTYSNDAKMEMLGVAEALIEEHGAVSEEVACMMAQGAVAHSSADIAVSVTGIAGPGGGTADKPVGLVHFAVARRGKSVTPARRTFGDIGRGSIREKSVKEAFDLVRSIL
ncbi:MAG: CinA family protein [Pseudomonadota bacterium]